MATVHMLGVPEQDAPGSSWQVAEQPSPLLVLPSSHFSLPVILPSPHNGTHGAAGDAALPAGLDRLAVGRAAVARVVVAVVAHLGGGHDAVVAFGVANAGLADVLAEPAVFDLTNPAATVSADGVVVVAGLAWIQHAVAARRGDRARNVDGASVELVVAAAGVTALAVAGAAATAAGACPGFTPAHPDADDEPQQNRQDT